MYQINLWAFYVIGHNIREIEHINDLIQLSKHAQAIDENNVASGNKIFHTLSAANAALSKLTQNEIIQITASKNAAVKLQEKITECLTYYDSGKFVFKEQEVEKRNKKQQFENCFLHLQREVERFEAVFSNELENLSTFFVPQKGTHSTPHLLESAVNNLSDDVRGRLSIEAVNDINAAGKCLALNLSTAAGFHILRAIEVLIRDYHSKVTGNVTAIKSRNWGAYIKDLEKKGADPKVTGFLTHIKDFYRNPIVHPEAGGCQEFCVFRFSVSPGIGILPSKIIAI